MNKQILECAINTPDIYDITEQLDCYVHQVFERIPQLVEFGYVQYDHIKLTIKVTGLGRNVLLMNRVEEKQIKVEKEVKEVKQEQVGGVVVRTRDGSKKQVVAGIIESNSQLSKKELIRLIVEALGVTESNAGVYIYNYNKQNG